MAYQPPPGISAPAVTNIPEKWSATWFRRFITQHLEGGDVRNAIPGPGITIQPSAANLQRGALTGRPIISAGGASGVPLSSIAPQAPFTVVANDTPTTASPTAISEAQLTSMVQTFSPIASGAVPASGANTSKFLRGDGTFASVPTPAPPPQIGSTLADDYVADDWTVPPGQFPGGPALSVQYNVGGRFVGNAKFVYDGNHTITVGDVVANTFNLNALGIFNITAGAGGSAGASVQVSGGSGAALGGHAFLEGGSGATPGNAVLTSGLASGTLAPNGFVVSCQLGAGGFPEFTILDSSATGGALTATFQVGSTPFIIYVTDSNTNNFLTGGPNTKRTEISSDSAVPIVFSGDGAKANTWLDGSGYWTVNSGHCDTSTSYQTPTTGFSITIPANCSDLQLIPAGTLATGTVTMPASPPDGLEVAVSSTQAVTALTVSANAGQTILGAPTTIAANGTFRYKYRLSNTTWYRRQ